MDLLERRDRRNVMIIALCTFLSLLPYFVWSINKHLNAILAVLLFFAVIEYFRELPIKRDRQISFFLLICFLYIFFGGTTYKAFSLIFVLPLLFILLPDYIKFHVFNKFVKVLSIILFAGFITYGLRFIYDLPYFTIQPLNELKGAYFVYLFDIHTLFLTFRYQSVFDEPGVVGTVCAILISYKPIEIRSFQGKVILLAGLLSLSLAFYIVLFINLLYNFNLKYIIPFILIVIGLSLLPENNVVKNNIFARMIIEDGKLSGDNRTVMAFDANYKDFLVRGGKDLWFGRGVYADKFDDEENEGGSSYKYLVYRHGILGIILFISLFAFTTWKIAPTKRGFFFFIIFILLAYQRINIFLLYNVVLFVGGLITIRETEIELKEYNNSIHKDQ